MDAEGHVVFDAAGAGMGGERVRVPVRGLGEVTVTVCGDASRPALLTAPDVGLTHAECFQGLFLCAPGLLAENFRVLHVDWPGHGSPAPPPSAAVSTAHLAEALCAVAGRFCLSEAVGMGAGLGAHALALACAEHGLSSRIKGLVLVSPLASPAGWWERGFAAAAQVALCSAGWSKWSLDHVAARLYAPERRTSRADGATASDLVRSFRAAAREAVSPRWCAAVLGAAVRRKGVARGLRAAAQSEGLHVLVVSGERGPFHSEAMELGAELAPTGRAASVVVENGSALLTGAEPASLASPVKLFIRRLQAEGLCAGAKLPPG